MKKLLLMILLLIVSVMFSQETIIASYVYNKGFYTYPKGVESKWFKEDVEIT